MSENTQMITLTINDQVTSVPKGTTVYKAATALGAEIPIFCYQDRMPPFGACRVCLVEVEKTGKLQTSCTLEATEGMVVKTESQIAKEGRKSILEFLLINHPLDCPICDRGGECPLQDQALQFGPGESRFFEEKRHFTKAKPLGPVLMLDRERCIVCARCTRFGDEIAGDHALEFIERGFKTEVGTPDGLPVESKFIGNTIQICPVGALTSQVYRFRARPWDNVSTESTCTLCPVGCSLNFDSRDGEVMRTRARENRAVNDIWLCDKGWFGYEFVSSPDRLNTPLIRKNGVLEKASWEEALSLIAAKLKNSKFGGQIAAWGGNPLTFEENFHYQELFRQGLGTNHLDHRIGSPLFSLEEEGIAPGMEISPGDLAELDRVVIFGADLTEEFPLLWLRLKSALNKGAKVLFFGHFAPEIASHLDGIFLHAPGEELKTLQEQKEKLHSFFGEGKKNALLIGRQYLATRMRKNILSALLPYKNEHTSLNLLEGKGNSQGARLAGMRPDLGAFGAKLEKSGLNAEELLEKISNESWEYLHVAGANPKELYPQELWNRVRGHLKFLVVQDLFLTETAKDADVVLPTLSYVEKQGNFLSIDGRVEPLLPGKDLPEGVLSDGQIFERIAERLHVALTEPKELPKRIVKETPAQIANESTQELSNNASLKATFAAALFDNGVRLREGEQVRQLEKPAALRIHPEEAASRQLQEGEIVTVVANGHSIFAPLHVDKGVAKGTVVLPLQAKDLPVANLVTFQINGVPVELKRGEKRC